MLLHSFEELLKSGRAHYLMLDAKLCRPHLQRAAMARPARWLSTIVEASGVVACCKILDYISNTNMTPEL